MGKIFAVSDVHGHYTELMRALDGAGFDPDNREHLFVSCGDLFDRGEENRRVWEFVEGLRRRVLISGNHDERLAEILDERVVKPHDVHNGTVITLTELFGRDCIWHDGSLLVDRDDVTARGLRRFLGSMRNYFETEHYIFTHGWLPLRRDEPTPHLRADWRTAGAEAWHAARFLGWPGLYGTAAMPQGKTVVCGHRSAVYGRMFDPQRSQDDCSIFFGDGLIAIDALTVHSGFVNVLVIDGDTGVES